MANAAIAKMDTRDLAREIKANPTAAARKIQKLERKDMSRAAMAKQAKELAQRYGVTASGIAGGVISTALLKAGLEVQEIRWIEERTASKIAAMGGQVSEAQQALAYMQAVSEAQEAGITKAGNMVPYEVILGAIGIGAGAYLGGKVGEGVMWGGATMTAVGLTEMLKDMLVDAIKNREAAAQNGG